MEGWPQRVDDQPVQFVPLASGGVVGRGRTHVNSRNLRSPGKIIRYDVAEGGLSQADLIEGGVRTYGPFVLDAQQRVLTAEGGIEPNFQLRMCRIHASEGTFDPSFGQGGCVSFSDMQYGNVVDIIALPSGGVLVSMSGGDAPLVQLTSTGVFDSGFGTDGVVRQFAHVSSLAAQSDGRVLLSFPRLADGTRGKLVRILPSGALDSSFGQGGEIPEAGGILQVGADDSFMVWSGQSLFSYLADGTPDVTFGTNGSVNVQELTGTTTSPFGIRAFTRDASGRIYVSAGFGTEASGFGGLLVRLTPSGSLDPDFQLRLGDGIHLHQVGSALAIGADGKVWTMMSFDPNYQNAMRLVLIHP
ncbi:protein of unknown function [Myxococcus fulvus]|uniref:Lipoprotein n=1 Tax=Myxococcus fulvus TaxID=33 RepID=A0ABY1CL14_MYXFU|nr:protein of unknown function [Myxococcus fulvus]